jgi:hypothetical protein
VDVHVEIVDETDYVFTNWEDMPHFASRNDNVVVLGLEWTKGSDINVRN